MSIVKFAPSILAADFGDLGKEIREAEKQGADWIHLDVMDGHFVPNISFGPEVVSTARRSTDLPLDVHLMIEKPADYVADFAAAGADLISVHFEACSHLHRVVEQIKELGVRAGVALNPATPIDSVKEILPSLDLLLLMTVNPGFGGQKYIPSSTDKITRARSLITELGVQEIELEVDGGIDARTAPLAVGAGATVLVAGSSVFQHSGGVKGGLQALRDVLT